jgi:hypothetical protein
VCNAGASDCNKNTAPDLDGCECATPGCCTGGTCETTHADGVGQNYYDCNALNTHNSNQALEACTAYAISQSKSATNCTDGWMCSSLGATPYVCFSADGFSCTNYCWQYTGAEAGWVNSCTNCTVKSGQWN